jgi:uncharacterized membrane protein YebE (DUF533 family)
MPSTKSTRSLSKKRSSTKKRSSSKSVVRRHRGKIAAGAALAALLGVGYARHRIRKGLKLAPGSF